MTQAGWTVLRFTWLDLTTRQAEVIRDVRRALQRAR
jgi:very-short-patch-repair endonuclease